MNRIEELQEMTLPELRQTLKDAVDLVIEAEKVLRDVQVVIREKVREERRAPAVIRCQ